MTIHMPLSTSADVQYSFAWEKCSIILSQPSLRLRPLSLSLSLVSPRVASDIATAMLTAVGAAAAGARAAAARAAAALDQSKSECS
eukprot:7381697-Prymnesium_polylepis.1